MNKWCKNHKKLGHTLKECETKQKNDNTTTKESKTTTKESKTAPYQDKQTSNSKYPPRKPSFRGEKTDTNNETPHESKSDNSKNINAKENKDFSTYVILETSNIVEQLDIPLIISDKHEEHGTIDCGAGLNFIKKDVLGKLKLNPKENKPVNVVFGNEAKEQTNLTVELELQLKDSKEGCKIVFYILENL